VGRLLIDLVNDCHRAAGGSMLQANVCEQHNFDFRKKGIGPENQVFTTISFAQFPLARYLKPHFPQPRLLQMHIAAEEARALLRTNARGLWRLEFVHQHIQIVPLVEHPAADFGSQLIETLAEPTHRLFFAHAAL
jgi:hypothetical protein